MNEIFYNKVRWFSCTRGLLINNEMQRREGWVCLGVTLGYKRYGLKVLLTGGKGVGVKNYSK
jgi:hypothetical protein